MDGWVLNNGQCQSCPNLCSQCASVNNTLTCFSCAAGYTLSNNACIACDSSCLACYQNTTTQTVQCSSCIPGFFLTVSKTCLQCALGCTRCSSLDLCLELEVGRVLMNNILVSCRIGCDRCDQVDPTKCLSCSTSYYLINSTVGICAKCSSNCLSCSSSSNCSACTPSTVLTSTSASVVECLPCATSNCLLCPSNINNCTKCRLGYNLIGLACVSSCSRGCL